MKDRAFVLTLCCVATLGPKSIFRLLDTFVSLKDLQAADGERLKLCCNLNQVQVAALKADTLNSRTDTVRKYLEKEGLRFISFWDAEYPDILRQIPEPPAGLFIRGRTEALQNFALAVVGTRNCDQYGIEITEQLCRDAAMLGTTIISGLARGIDTIGHLTAVRAGTPTLAVLGTTPDSVYPAENRALARKIVDDGGAIISELAPGSATVPAHFIRRNRIISGLSRGVVVTQAPLGSGAIQTAYFAVEQNRDVFAVPGPVNSPRQAGCHKLIREGAKLTESIEDIIQEYSYLSEKRDPQLSWLSGIDRSAALSEDERKVLDCMQNTLMYIDELKHSCGLNIPKILSSLLNLELKGYVRQYPGKYFKRTV